MVEAQVFIFFLFCYILVGKLCIFRSPGTGYTHAHKKEKYIDLVHASWRDLQKIRCRCFH